jgi:DNA-binding NarL/FixJ family response regulator
MTGSKQVSVLIVDDDRWTTRALTTVLGEQEGFFVYPAVHSGEAAVQAYREHRPDVVLMDVNMYPGMNGIEATRQIIALDSAAHIVILTTTAPGPGLARALQEGALGAVDKTVDEEELFAIVRLAAGGEDPRLLKNLTADVVISGDVLPEAPARFPPLTPTEMSILKEICRGCSYAEIADAMFVSETTVKSHASHLRAKLRANSLSQLVVRAMQYRLVSIA